MIIFTDSGLKEFCFTTDSGKIVCKKHDIQVTVNEAEYIALISALTWVDSHDVPDKLIEFKSDSQLMVNQINGTYKCKSPRLGSLKKTVWSIARKLIKAGKEISFSWVPREENPAGIYLEYK
jgi:ribonuclease HI